MTIASTAFGKILQRLPVRDEALEQQAEKLWKRIYSQIGNNRRKAARVELAALEENPALLRAVARKFRDQLSKDIADRYFDNAADVLGVIKDTRVMREAVKLEDVRDCIPPLMKRRQRENLERVLSVVQNAPFLTAAAAKGFRAGLDQQIEDSRFHDLSDVLLTAKDLAPALRAVVTPDDIRVAVDVLLDRGQVEDFADLLCGISDVPFLLAAVRPEDVRLGLRGQLDKQAFGFFAATVTAISDRPDLLETVTTNDMRTGISGLMERGWFDDAADVLRVAVSAPALHTGAAKAIRDGIRRQRATGRFDDFTDMLLAIDAGAPSLLLTVTADDVKTAVRGQLERGWFGALTALLPALAGNPVLYGAAAEGIRESVGDILDRAGRHRSTWRSSTPSGLTRTLSSWRTRPPPRRVRSVPMHRPQHPNPAPAARPWNTSYS